MLIAQQTLSQVMEFRGDDLDNLDTACDHIALPTTIHCHIIIIIFLLSHLSNHNLISTFIFPNLRSFYCVNLSKCTIWSTYTQIAEHSQKKSPKRGTWSQLR